MTVKGPSAKVAALSVGAFLREISLGGVDSRSAVVCTLGTGLRKPLVSMIDVKYDADAFGVLGLSGSEKLT